MCYETYAKGLLVVMAMMDLVLVGFENLGTLGCSRPPLWCKILPFCVFLINAVCLVCIYVGLNNGNPRLFTPYYIYVCARVVLICVTFLIVLASLGGPTPKFECDDCECKCPDLSDISPHDREWVMQYALRIALAVLFIQICWDILTLTLIRMVVPDAMRFTRRREPPPIYEDQNPQYQSPPIYEDQNPQYQSPPIYEYPQYPAPL